MAVIASHNSRLTSLHHQEAGNNGTMCPPSFVSNVVQHDFETRSSQILPLHACKKAHHFVQESHACQHCKELCSKPLCCQCIRGSADNSPFPSPENSFYTICQVRRHCTVDSAWLVMGDTIYDATFYISRHPGGTESILKKSGGRVDCTIDFEFHSKKAQAMWKKHKVGKLRPCGPNAQLVGIESQCTIC